MGYWRDNDRRGGYRDNRGYDRNNGYNNRGGYDRYDDRGYDNRGYNDRPQYNDQQPHSRRGRAGNFSDRMRKRTVRSN